MHLDRRIADLVRAQHGLVTLEQLRSAGLGGPGVRKRVRAGRLHRIHREVYAVGHPVISRTAQMLAAVLACGEDAALSHLPAAEKLGVRRASPRLEVSVPRPGGRTRPGVVIHRVAPWHPQDLCTIDGVPTTTLPRTLVDIASAVGQRGVERAIAEAQHLKMFDRGAMRAAIIRMTGRRGVAIVRAALEVDGIEKTRTNKELEERALALIRRGRLPIPEVNVLIEAPGGPYKCDFVWRDARLIVETDGRAAHVRESQFEEDRRRDANLKLAGWQVLRFTWRQVVSNGGWVLSIIGEMLRPRPLPPPSDA